MAGGNESLERATELAQLLVRVASSRPDILDALRTLLLVALEAPPSRDRSDFVDPTDAGVLLGSRSAGPASPAPAESDRGTVGATPCEGAPPTPKAHPALEEDRSPPTEPSGISNDARGASRSPSPEDRKAAQGLEALLHRFGSGATAAGGLSKTTIADTAKPIGQWDADSAAARRLERLFRAQTRRLRAARIARHDGRPIPPCDGSLAHECIDDWTALPGRLDGIASSALKEGERWHATTSAALRSIGDWLADNPSAPLGRGATPQALRDRMQCLAIAQKGVYCWIESQFGGGVRCALQTEVYTQLRRWIREDYFAIYLSLGMQLSQIVETQERNRVTRDLERLDLEHAVDEGAARSTEASADRSPCESAKSRRFDHVIDAFECARSEFSCPQLVFTDAAASSAEDSAFKRPDDVYDFLAALHQIALARSTRDRDGIPIEEDFRSHGFAMKPCSKKTMKRHYRHYHMAFEGADRPLSLHVTLGSRNQNTCISIHWWHDEEQQRFVIGHCGKHLPNTLT